MWRLCHWFHICRAAPTPHHFRRRPPPHPRPFLRLRRRRLGPAPCRAGCPSVCMLPGRAGGVCKCLWRAAAWAGGVRVFVPTASSVGGVALSHADIMTRGNEEAADVHLHTQTQTHQSRQGQTHKNNNTDTPTLTQTWAHTKLGTLADTKQGHLLNLHWQTHRHTHTQHATSPRKQPNNTRVPMHLRVLWGQDAVECCREEAGWGHTHLSGECD